jgi:hypothetical protein
MERRHRITGPRAKATKAEAAEEASVVVEGVVVGQGIRSAAVRVRLSSWRIYRTTRKSCSRSRGLLVCSRF